MAQNNYAELVAQAEKAVASVKDPALKGIAFQKILDDLLSTSNDAEPVASKVKASHAQRAPSAKARGKTKGGPTAYIQELVDAHFFKKPKTVVEIQGELSNRAHTIGDKTIVRMTLKRLCLAKVLRRAKPSGSSEFSYSNW